MRRLGLLVIGLALVLSGCGLIFPRAPQVDISGTWSGMWSGQGIVGTSNELTTFAGSAGTAPRTTRRGIIAIPRDQVAYGEFSQNGNRGRGRIVLDGAIAAEDVPVAIRVAGSAGSRVLVEVSGTKVTMMHELGASNFTAEFRVNGDRMVGHILGSETPVQIVLNREVPGQRRGEAPRPGIAMPPPPPPTMAPAPPTADGGREPQPGAQQQPETGKPPDVAAAQPPVTGPEPQRPATKDYVSVPELVTINFEFDKADIGPATAALLDKNVEWLKSGNMLVLIEGHADERGTNEYNLALGERRARAVRDYLLAHGIEADRINTVSYGEERPLCTEKTEDCWRRNRRADFLVKPK